MADYDWRDLGRDIRDIVQDAIDTKDFYTLNQTIQKTIGQALDSVSQGVRNAGQEVGQAMDDMTRTAREKEAERHAVRTKKKRWEQLYRDSTALKVGGTAMTFAGSLFSAGSGIAIFVLGCIGVSLGSFPLGFRIALSLLIPSLIGFGILAVKGSSLLSRIRRYRLYLRRLGDHSYCNIAELAEAVSKPVPYVQKELGLLIQKGWFREGHFDEEKTCLMTDHETYRQYCSLAARRKELAMEEESRRKEEAARAVLNPLPPQVQEALAEGQKFIEKLHACNEAIPGPEISEKISRIELLAQRIFQRVEQHPESLPDIRRLMEYYLPTTIKLLNAYAELDDQPVEGENIEATRREIEATLDTLNLALEKLLDGLFQDVSWDVSSDIVALKTMLAQEGLTEGDFSGSPRKDQL